MKVKFSRCNSNSLADVPQVDGQLIFVKDISEVYIDVGNNRNKLSDLIEVADITNVQNPITSKLYYDNATEKLYKAKVVNNTIVWIDITGATVSFVNTEIQDTKNYADGIASAAESNAKTYADTNFLKKTNTTAFTPTADYHPSTKKYVDDSFAAFTPLQSFPTGTNTTGTTQQFFSSINAKNPAVGSLFLGLVNLTDMPTGLTQAEVQVEVYNNDVLYATMRSANLAPYVWYCNSYDYRGWEAQSAPAAEHTSFDNTDTDLESTNVEDAIVELNNKIGNLNSLVEEINGE